MSKPAKTSLLKRHVIYKKFKDWSTDGCRQRYEKISKRARLRKWTRNSDQLAHLLDDICETVDDNVKALINFYYFPMNGIRFIAALPAPARVAEGGRQRLPLLTEIKSHGSSKDVTSLTDKFRRGQLFLNDQIDSLAPEGFLGNEAEWRWRLLTRRGAPSLLQDRRLCCQKRPKRLRKLGQRAAKIEKRSPINR